MYEEKWKHILTCRLRIQPEQKVEKKGRGHVYNTDKTSRFQKDIGRLVKQKMIDHDVSMIRNPIMMDVCFHRQIPKSYTLGTKKKIAGRLIGNRKPDLTNLQKSFEDGMNEILYDDDMRNCMVTMSKRWSDEEYGYITLTVYEEIDPVYF